VNDVQRGVPRKNICTYTNFAAITAEFKGQLADPGNRRFIGENPDKKQHVQILIEINNLIH